MRITRIAASAAMLAVASTTMAATASADPTVVKVTTNETIDLSNSNIYSDAPVPGAMTAGQFNVANESAYSLPAGYSVTVNWHVVTPAKTTGAKPGYQSFISTTATPSLASSYVKYSGATNATYGKDGSATVTVAKTLDPGKGIYGTWSGANFSADFENATTMRYRVSVTAPSKTMTYVSYANTPDGTLQEITHNVTIKGGTFTYDKDL